MLRELLAARLAEGVQLERLVQATEGYSGVWGWYRQARGYAGCANSRHAKSAETASCVTRLVQL